jgi:hypothetical protein
MRSARIIYVALTLSAAISLGVAQAAPAATQQGNATAVAQQPFLFSYTFNQHLKIGGGNFTLGGRVHLTVKFNNGRVAFKRNVTAQPHAITPGGTIYVETTIASPCAPGNNGYARGYDYTTKTWSPRLPVPICVRID